MLGRLRSFGVQEPLFNTFFDTIVASTIFHSVVCIMAANRKRLDRLIQKASSVLGCSLEPLKVVGKKDDS